MENLAQMQSDESFPRTKYNNTVSMFATDQLSLAQEVALLKIQILMKDIFIDEM